MSDFKIEKGHSIPEFGRKGGAPAKYPWRQMEVGDSFFVATKTSAEVERFRGAVSGASARYKPQRWITRQVAGGIRAWRVA